MRIVTNAVLNHIENVLHGVGLLIMLRLASLLRDQCSDLLHLLGKQCPDLLQLRNAKKQCAAIVFGQVAQ